MDTPMSDDPIYSRAAVYLEQTRDGQEAVVYRASSFGYCIGALVRARMGMTASLPPEFMAERYQEGHDWEQRVLLAGLGVDWVTVGVDSELERLGQIVEGQNGERQVEAEISWMDGRRVVRVHPDAIVRHADRHLRVAEVKFLGQDFYDRTIAGIARDGMRGLGPGYAWQGSIEMLATGLPMLYVIGQKKVKGDGDKREVDLGSVVTYEFDEPCYSLKDVKMRVGEVEGWVARGEMPPCVVPFDYPCGYWQEHEARDAEEITDGVLVDLVEGYERAMVKVGLHQAEAARIKTDIDARMTEVGVDGGKCAGWTISRTGARKGNVSWAQWAKVVRERYPNVKLDEDQFRGKDVEAGLRMEKDKAAGRKGEG